MGKQSKFSDTIDTSKASVKVTVSIIIFEEDGSQIVYCPALDVSGYGKDEAEAHHSFKISLSEFIQYSINKGTFYEELKRMGWTVRKSKTKPMLPPSMSHILSNNDNFSRIFNSFPFRKIDTILEMPAIA
jgi:hypothetical protein